MDTLYKNKAQFEFDGKNEYHSYVKKWNEQVKNEYLKTVLGVFKCNTELVIEFWLDNGVIATWAKGYEEKRKPLAVFLASEEWLLNWNNIADKIQPDSWFEKEINEYEESIINIVTREITETLNLKYTIDYFIRNEKEYYLN